MDNGGIVNILNCNGVSVGTGFYASPNGYILTCFHVLEEAGSINTASKVAFRFVAAETIFFATLKAINKEKDVAVLHVDLLPVVHYAIKACGRIGDRLYTLGFPNGDKIGIPAEPVLQDYIEREKLIQLKEANTITYGFSGAPLVTEKGFAVGMVAWIPRDDGGRMEDIAHAIPAQIIIDTFSEYLATEEEIDDECSLLKGVDKADCLCYKANVLFTDQNYETALRLYYESWEIYKEVTGVESRRVKKTYERMEAAFKRLNIPDTLNHWLSNVAKER